MLVIIRGGGDLASGVAVRLHRSGFQVLITELPEPLVVRRTVSFAEAVHAGVVQVEDITGELIPDLANLEEVLESGHIPVLVDPDLSLLTKVKPDVLVDARMRKEPSHKGKEEASLVIGLGPGFVAGENCHAVVETNRGHNLGRVIWQGAPEPNTGSPGEILGYSSERVLRAPIAGTLSPQAEIGERLKRGSLIAVVREDEVLAPFDGFLRGLIRGGTQVSAGQKIGDVDPRDDPNLVKYVSDKSRVIGGGVLEAILSCLELRSSL
jgi:xanthine dehydrogenase accessory factor